MLKTAAALMLWASAYTGMPTADMPEIRTGDRCEVQVAATGRECQPAKRIATAAYRDGVVYLPKDWSHKRPYHMSLLLHELVHHMQWVQGRQIHCRAERQAYAAQMTWLRQQGHDPYEVIDFTPWKLFELTHVSCRD